MLRDARELEPDTVFESDLCIIGAGAAGIALARALAGPGIRVCLLESGGLEYDDDVQALYNAENIGLPYVGLDYTRLRYFGGSTNHWGGMCRPFDAMDFDKRPWVPFSGWPIRQSDLEPYYIQAHEFCRLANYDYEGSSWYEKTLPHFDEEKLTFGVWQIRPILFGEFFRKEMVENPNIDLILHANALEFVTNPEGNEVREVALATLDRRRFTARADRYVLACGGLENPRLLLLSDRQMSAGVGNQNDNVGRFFIEHPRVFTARAMVESAKQSAALHSTMVQPGGVGVLPCLSLAPSQQRREQTLNFGCRLYADFIGDSGFAALRRVYRSLARGHLPDDLSEDLATVILNSGDTVNGLLRRFGFQEAEQHGQLLIWSQLEQQPQPDSRVRLSEERDALGLRRLQLDWRLTDLDKHTLRVGNRVLAEEFGRAGLGRVQIADWLLPEDNGWGDEIDHNQHHMGTTRMSDDPRRGVVDADCRVHGMANLYIAGSSVFPTGGWANPTLTILALTLRLADHLRDRFAA